MRSAVVLLAAFYAFTFGVAAALLALPFVLDGVPVNGRVACATAAVLVLWLLLPRPARFVPPGPRLLPASQPRLFAEIERVAGLAAQPMPAEVYLLFDVDAFIAERGGWFGSRRRRVIGIGLPLLQRFSVSELRGVLAHEFGHYHGDSLRLTAWFHRTRGALERTIIGLSKRDSWVLRVPFLWYWKHYMRSTQAVARDQELVADRLAADVAGARAVADGLRKSEQLAPAFRHFMEAEFIPVLAAGRRPPLLAGFDTFLEHARVKTVLADVQHKGEQRDAPEEFDSHPPIGARIAALGSLDDSAAAIDARPAIALLDEVPGLELELLASCVGGVDVRTMPRIGWDAVCEVIVLPQWDSHCRIHAAALAGVRVSDLARVARDLERVSYGLTIDRTTTTRDQQLGYTRTLFDCALGLALRKQGWLLSTRLGDTVVATRGDERLQIIGIVQGLESETDPEQSWRSTCARLGIQDAPLSPD